MGQDKLPLPWHQAFFAIIPGILATMGLITTDFSAEMSVGLILLFTFLAAGFWWNHRQLPGWSLMAAGMLTSVGLTLASGLIGGLTAIVAGRSANAVVLLVWVAVMIALLGYSMRIQPVPASAWVLFALIIVCQLAVRLKYFLLSGVSWSVAGQWFNISMYAAVIGLLLPVALGLVMTKRYGRLTMLYAIGMIYMGFQILIDVNYKVSDRMADSAGFIAYKTLIPFLFTVAAPLWFLRARSARRRAGGMLTLICAAVIFDLLVVGLSYAGELPIIIWISFIPYTISLLLALLSAHLLYKDSEKRSAKRSADAWDSVPPH